MQPGTANVRHLLHTKAQPLGATQEINAILAVVALETDLIKHRSAGGHKTARVVAHPPAQQKRRERIDSDRKGARRQAVADIFAAAHVARTDRDVRPCVQPVEQQRDRLRRHRQVAVHPRYGVRVRRLDAGPDGRRETALIGSVQQPHARLTSRDLRHNLPRAVGRVVIYHQHLNRRAHTGQDAHDQDRDVLAFVIGRQDDSERQGRRGR